MSFSVVVKRASAVAVFALSLLAAPHRLQVHSNRSLTIYSIAEQDHGLWLATNDGLYRFDGLHYRKITEYPFPSARHLAVAADGSFWIGGDDGLVRYQKEFRLIDTRNVYGLAALKEWIFDAEVRTVNGNIQKYALFRRSPDGTQSALQGNGPVDSVIPDTSGNIWFACEYDESGCRQGLGGYDDRSKFPITERSSQLARDRFGRLWWARDAAAGLLASGEKILLRREPRPLKRTGPFWVGREGRVWFTGETVTELADGPTFSDSPKQSRHAPLTAFEDSRQRLWVATQGRGLLEWNLDSGWERWHQSDFNGQYAAQLLRAGSDLIAVTHGGMFRLEETSRTWNALSGAEQQFDAALALPGGQILATAREIGVGRFAHDGRRLEALADPGISKIGYRILARDGAGRIWVGHKEAFFRLEGQPGSLRLVRVQLPRFEFQTDVVDMEIDAHGQPWIICTAGIATLDARGQWEMLPLDPPIRFARSLALEGNHTIWLSVRNEPAFFKLTRNGNRWTRQRFDAGAGYGPKDTLYIKRDSRGWLWRGTPEGVFVSDGIHIAPEDWLHLKEDNGYSGGEVDNYGFFEDTDHSVWLAGEQGITHVHPDPSWFDAPRGVPPPAITFVNRPQPNALHVEIGSLYLPPFRDAPLRYRLRGLDDTWRSSRDGTLDWHDLSAGEYTLEFAYAGNGAQIVQASFSVSVASSRIWWLLAVLPLAAVPWSAQRVSRAEWYGRLRYRLRKSEYLMRRRLRERLAPPPSDLTGRLLLDRFEVGRPFIRGGFSTIYSARDRTTGARVAIKQLHQESTENDAIRARFTREVATIRSIQHQNVVPVLESWIDPQGGPCLAMPFLDGRTLREELKSGPLAPQRAAPILRQTGSALAAIHARGIVHRDLKPENILLVRRADHSESPVLIDFGIAGLRGQGDELAATRTLAGSLQYMAPEGLTGHYSPATDVYSLAVMALEMLTLATPGDFELAASEPGFAQEVARPLERVMPPVVAAGVAQILAQACCPVPSQRPEAGAFAGQLADLLTSAPAA